VDALLHRLVSEAAHADPSREAVRCRGVSLTYGELEGASNGVARALIEGGVRRGDRVALCLPKRVEAVAAIYGILKAGAAYVPLDPKAPPMRLGMIAADCAVRAVVGEPEPARVTLRAMEGNRPELVVLVGEGEAGEDLGGRVVGFGDATSDPHATDPGVPATEEDLAYILYTSGSTGVPKGVMLTHRNALAFVRWCADAIGVGPEDRLSNHAPFHFDLSVFDLYLAAVGRAAVLPVPEEDTYLGPSLLRFIQDQRITVWYSVPSALMLLTRVAGPGAIPSVRTIAFAGEVYPTRHLRELRRLAQEAELWNLYGPTETNVITAHRVEELPQDDRTLPIGSACSGAEVFALKEDGAVGGVGEVGELFARGPTVMRGYWGQPEKTAEVLVPDPRRPDLPGRVYRTGDLVRLREDGAYDFLGRRDHQIKSRGYRIELGEVEAALTSHPSILEAAAVAVPHEQWGTAIVACVVPKKGAPPLRENDVKRHVARRLPRYMVPASVAIMDDLPRTSNGKIDRQRILEERAPTLTP